MFHSRLLPPAFPSGSVWLVGAGPGDPGLLTLHAWHALSQADVVLHDALVSTDILSLARQARLESVGKRAAGTRTPQLRINQRLIALARQGLRVVRLKGGDPLIFGRGGEEAIALAAACIPFRIVPGVSAGVGGTAAAGVPLTHRGVARGVTIATGHDLTGGPADTDWDALARGPDTLVLYMGLRHLSTIARRLIEAGRPGSQPVALISNATIAAQTVRVTTLAEAGTVAAPSGAPTLIVIGDVVALRPLLAVCQDTTPMTLAEPAEPARARG